MNSLGIKNHEITKDFYPNPDEPVDWEYIEKKLAEQREKSREYIEKIKAKL